MDTGLYLHIPFCVRKCVYCDFYSVETGTGPIGQRLRNPLPGHEEFLDALETELRGLPPSFRPTTLFIGGGTPTELSDSDLARLFSMLHQYVDLSAVREWTCEVNPGTLTIEKGHCLKHSGVNRVSLGAQSFDPENLAFLGRIHAGNDIPLAYELSRRAGFDHINVDLIYGIPGSNLEKTANDIQTVVRLDPEHVSCYALTFEEGTPLMEMKRSGHVSEADDEAVMDHYRLICRILSDAGYVRYEISNFSRPGRQCRHNLLYWSGGEYIGCGPSAHSHWKGRRYANVRQLSAYLSRIEERGQAQDFAEELPPEAKARETLVMWLRRTDGVPADEFRATTGFDYRDIAGESIDELIAEGLLALDHARLRLTESGIWVSNRIFAELI